MDNMNTGRSPVDDIHILGGGNLGSVDGIVCRSGQQNYFLDREEGNNSNNCTDSGFGSANILVVDTDMYDIYHPRPPPPEVEVDNSGVALQRAS